MGKVWTGATMSIDGYIAGPGESGFDLLFQWYNNGDVEIPTGNPEMTFRTSAASARHWKELIESTGALLVGRHLYDFTNAWGGRHPMDVTTVVLTHRLPDDRPAADENFVFVTEGIEAAVAAAQKIAGAKDVGVNGGQMARQCLDAGLLDEVHVDLVPVLLGAGTPFFSELGTKPVQLYGPTSIVEGTGVTHLAYTVRPASAAA
jgi:dihydrofolate reductase